MLSRAVNSTSEDRRNRRLPDPKININKLSANILNEIQNRLDAAPKGKGWRAFVNVLEDKFSFNQIEVEQFGLVVQQINGSPTRKLFNRLSSRDFKVKDLISCLDVLGWENLLIKLKPYEPLKLLRSPKDKLGLREGDTLKLEVDATGFPYPRYQWFRGDKEVDSAMESVLILKNIRKSDEGSYCCRLHNTADMDKVIFTETTGVTVRENPSMTIYSRVQTHSQGFPIQQSGLVGDDKSVLQTAPRILTQSRDITVSSGDMVNLHCFAIGPLELRYEWLKNGMVIQDSTSHEYKVENTALADTGSYECRVRNIFGVVKSDVIYVLVKGESIAPALHMCFPPGHAFTFDIITQPKSSTIEKGGSALFTCGVISQGHVNYQWYKDGKPLPGENRNKLMRENVCSFDMEGCFQCRVSNGSYDMLSAGAYLRLDNGNEIPVPTDKTIYTAMDKIALLIGNYDYIGSDSLKAPKTDVQVLAELFRSMNFKVVSLLNLTLGEMEAAVNEFCTLLGSGVYGVFYFCGHGIEEKGQCYLVPQDAPTGFTSRNCLCAQFVLTRMQDLDPAICCMILDCCRISNSDHENTLESSRQMTTYIPRPTGNSVFLYATTQGMKAYEYDTDPSTTSRLPLPEPNGILVKYLQRHLCKRKSIEAVFADVREDISSDKNLRDRQIPEVKTNLVNTQRSFSDKIVYSGQTEVFSQRYKRWQNAHTKPTPQEICVKHLGITVHIDYQADFSNVLSILLTVKDPGVTQNCIAWVINLPPTLSVMTVKQIAHFPMVQTKTVIQDIQKLKESLVLTITLEYILDDKKCSFNGETIDLDFPLISTLGLWKRDCQRNVNGHPIFGCEREPMEHYMYQGEEHSYVNCEADRHYVNMPLPCKSRGGPPYVNLQPIAYVAPYQAAESNQNIPPVAANEPPAAAFKPLPVICEPLSAALGPPAGNCGLPPPPACGSTSKHLSHTADVSLQKDVVHSAFVSQATNTPQSETGSLPKAGDTSQLEATLNSTHISPGPV